MGGRARPAGPCRLREQWGLVCRGPRGAGLFGIHSGSEGSGAGQRRCTLFAPNSCHQNFALQGQPNGAFPSWPSGGCSPWGTLPTPRPTRRGGGSAAGGRAPRLSGSRSSGSACRGGIFSPRLSFSPFLQRVSTGPEFLNTSEIVNSPRLPVSSTWCKGSLGKAHLSAPSDVNSLRESSVYTSATAA